MQEQDQMSFECSSPALSEWMACQYALLHHLQSFWTHVVVGVNKPLLSELFAPERELLELFRVSLEDGTTFHWAAIVMEFKVILSMWFIHKGNLVLLDQARDVMESEIGLGSSFHDLVYTLNLWFCSHFEEKDVQFVIGCQPVEDRNLVSFLSQILTKELGIATGPNPPEEFQGRVQKFNKYSHDYIKGLIESSHLNNTGPKNVNLKLLLAGCEGPSESGLMDPYGLPPPTPLPEMYKGK